MSLVTKRNARKNRFLFQEELSFHVNDYRFSDEIRADRHKLYMSCKEEFLAKNIERKDDIKNSIGAQKNANLL